MWFKNFQANRVQTVKVNNSFSSQVHVLSGVPQGTVLGPLLFLLYSADLPSVVRDSTISMFADDTKVYKGIRGIEDCWSLQSDLDRVSHWANQWQMDLNPDKTKVLIIGKSKFNFDYKIQGTAIEIVSHIKDIGVTMQSNLKFTIHCNDMVRKAYFTMRNIFNTFRNHYCIFYLKLFTTYVRPVLEYASQVWSPSLIKNIDKIESVQRYFTRRILENVNGCYLDRLQHLQIDTLEQRRIKADLSLFFKLHRNLVDTDIKEVFTYRNNDILRGHSSQLYVEFSRTERRQSFYCNRIVSKWNSLPQEAVNSPTILAFKRHLQSLTFTGRGSIFSSM